MKNKLIKKIKKIFEIIKRLKSLVDEFRKILYNDISSSGLILKLISYFNKKDKIKF